MARYATTIRSDRPAAGAFAFVADLSNLPQWDPGVSEARQVRGVGLGADAAFDVTLSTVGNTVLTYETTEWSPDLLEITLVANHSWFRSIDRVSATGDQSSSEVTYDATLELRGPLGLFDPLFAPVFNRIGDKAAAGLAAALQGEKVV